MIASQPPQVGNNHAGIRPRRLGEDAGDDPGRVRRGKARSADRIAERDRIRAARTCAEVGLPPEEIGHLAGLTSGIAGDPDDPRIGPGKHRGTARRRRGDENDASLARGSAGVPQNGSVGAKPEAHVDQVDSLLHQPPQASRDDGRRGRERRVEDLGHSQAGERRCGADDTREAGTVAEPVFPRGTFEDCSISVKAEGTSCAHGPGQRVRNTAVKQADEDRLANGAPPRVGRDG